MHAGLEVLEAGLMARRRAEADVCGAFQASFALVSGVGSAGAPAALQAAGAMIARAVEARAVEARAGGAAEPAYHNRHHAAEATLAMGWLCREALNQGMISAVEAATGVVAMVGHDLDHDGSTVGGGVLEARSWAAVRPIAAAAGLDDGLLAGLGDVILATDPALVGANAARMRGEAPGGPLGAGQDVLRVLANEADVFASLLPRLGPLLSQLLAEEWRPSGDPVLLRVGTAAGRYTFLRAYPAMSGPAVALGLETARHRCLDAYAAAARRLGREATAEMGCLALDSMQPEAARALYAAALDGL